jgi:hypothetical protein
MTDNERMIIDSFRSGHVCPNRKLHDRKPFNVEISGYSANGIGPNTYIKCLRCGCQQDVTDYGAW